MTYKINFVVLIIAFLISFSLGFVAEAHAYWYQERLNEESIDHMHAQIDMLQDTVEDLRWELERERQAPPHHREVPLPRQDLDNLRWGDIMYTR